jgi:flagellar assembly protein FliH
VTPKRDSLDAEPASLSQMDDIALKDPEAAVEPSSDVVDRLDTALRRLHDVQEGLIHRARAEVVELAMQIARHVIAQNVAHDDADLGPVVDDAIRQLGDALSVVVRVGPRHHAALSARHGQDRRIQVVLDPSLGDGDIVVDSDSGSVDARLESRLDAVARAVRASVGSP